MCSAWQMKRDTRALWYLVLLALGDNQGTTFSQNASLRLLLLSHAALNHFGVPLVGCGTETAGEHVLLVLCFTC